MKIYFDGGSRGNPGPASGAAYADYEGGHEKACFLEHATNNEAEYRGLLMAIELAKELKLKKVVFLGDSKLVVSQVRGEWQAKNPMMAELKQLVLTALRTLPGWQIDWVRREFNSEADRVANQMMDAHQGLEPLAKFDKVKVEAAPIEKAQMSQDGNPAPIRADIKKLNDLGSKASFNDFRGLKVGGMDAFSKAKMEALETMIPQFAALKENFALRLNTDRNTQTMADADKAKLMINALRWSARGLAGDLAIRKVLTDLEVTNNIRGKK